MGAPENIQKDDKCKRCELHGFNLHTERPKSEKNTVTSIPKLHYHPWRSQIYVLWWGVHFYSIYFNMCILQYSANFDAFLMFLLYIHYYSQFISNMINIDTRNFINCFVLPYSVSTSKLDGNVKALSLATRTDQYRNVEFASGDDPCVVLDQYLGKEGLETLILEKGNVSDNDLS